MAVTIGKLHLESKYPRGLLYKRGNMTDSCILVSNEANKDVVHQTILTRMMIFLNDRPNAQDSQCHLLSCIEMLS